MSVLVFRSDLMPDKGRLEETLRRELGEEEISVFSSFPEIKAGLVGRLSEIDALILAPCSEEELEELLSLRDALLLVPCVVILPERRPLAIRKAHRLYPRYLTFQDEEMRDLADVVKKLIEKKRERGF